MNENNTEYMKKIENEMMIHRFPHREEDDSVSSSVTTGRMKIRVK